MALKGKSSNCNSNKHKKKFLKQTFSSGESPTYGNVKDSNDYTLLIIRLSLCVASASSRI